VHAGLRTVWFLQATSEYMCEEECERGNRLWEACESALVNSIINSASPPVSPAAAAAAASSTSTSAVDPNVVSMTEFRAFVSKQLRAEYFNAELSLLHTLSQMSTQLARVPRKNNGGGGGGGNPRTEKLRAYLRALQASNQFQHLYFPSQSMHDAHYRVLRVFDADCFCLNSRDKAPFMLHFAVEYTGRSNAAPDVYKAYHDEDEQAAQMASQYTALTDVSTPSPLDDAVDTEMETTTTTTTATTATATTETGTTDETATTETTTTTTSKEDVVVAEAPTDVLTSLSVSTPAAAETATSTGPPSPPPPPPSPPSPPSPSTPKSRAADSDTITIPTTTTAIATAASAAAVAPSTTLTASPSRPPPLPPPPLPPTTTTTTTTMTAKATAATRGEDDEDFVRVSASDFGARDAAAAGLGGPNDAARTNAWDANNAANGDLTQVPARHAVAMLSSLIISPLIALQTRTIRYRLRTRHHCFTASQLLDWLARHFVRPHAVRTHDMGELVSAAIDTGGLLKTRRHRLSSYKRCLIATDLVSWLVDAGYVHARPAGVVLGQRLVDAGYLQSVYTASTPTTASVGGGDGGARTHTFRDEWHLYYLYPLPRMRGGFGVGGAAAATANGASMAATATTSVTADTAGSEEPSPPVSPRAALSSPSRIGQSFAQWTLANASAVAAANRYTHLWLPHRRSHVLPAPPTTTTTTTPTTTTTTEAAASSSADADAAVAGSNVAGSSNGDSRVFFSAYALARRGALQLCRRLAAAGYLRGVTWADDDAERAMVGDVDGADGGDGGNGGARKRRRRDGACVRLATVCSSSGTVTSPSRFFDDLEYFQLFDPAVSATKALPLSRVFTIVAGDAAGAAHDESSSSSSSSQGSPMRASSSLPEGLSAMPPPPRLALTRGGSSTPPLTALSPLPSESQRRSTVISLSTSAPASPPTLTTSTSPPPPPLPAKRTSTDRRATMSPATLTTSASASASRDRTPSAAVVGGFSSTAAPRAAASSAMPTSPLPSSTSSSSSSSSPSPAPPAGPADPFGEVWARRKLRLAREYVHPRRLAAGTSTADVDKLHICFRRADDGGDDLSDEDNDDDDAASSSARNDGVGGVDSGDVTVGIDGRQRGEWDLKSMIFKGGDDLRQEHLAMQLIKRFDTIFWGAGLPLWLRTYDVLVTAADAGLIETVANSTSIDSLKKDTPGFTTLADFFENFFGPRHSPTHARAQRNFVSSMAAYAVVAYVLQIKDRHNGNILLDRFGHVIHIDFGFMLSSSPGGNANFETSPFKLTRQDIEVMGGEASSTFAKFKLLFLRGFLEARRHAHEFMLLVEVMTMGKGAGLACLAPTTLSALSRRFFLHLSDDEIVPAVMALVEESQENWRTQQYDYYQKIANGIN
jgi:hypothetical protein